MNTDELDRVLARAVADLERAIPAAGIPQRSAPSRIAPARWGRVAAAAVALVGAGVAVGFAVRDGAGSDEGDTPGLVVTVGPSPSASSVSPAPTDVDTGVTAPPPATTLPSAAVESPAGTMAPDGDPVGLGYRIPDQYVPAGYEMVAAYDGGVGSPTNQAPVFHGVAVMLDDRGMPASPAIHVEVQDQAPAMQGAATPVDINGIGGEYVVWDQQLINASSSPTADVRWQLPSGKWLTVSGPSLDFVLLQVARSASVDDAGAVSITPPTGFTYLPSWFRFGGGNGAGVVYEGPELATISITVQRREDSLVVDALKNYSASNLTVRNGAPAVEYSGSRGLSSVSFEPTPGVRVFVTHSTPRTVRDLNARLPLDRSTLDEIIDSLEQVDGDTWTSLQEQIATGYTLSNPQFPQVAGFGDAEVSLTGVVEVPVTDLNGATERTLPVEFTRSIDGQYTLRYGGFGAINLGAAPDVSAFRGNLAAPEPDPVLVEAGVDVDQLVMIRPTGERVPVALVEVAPELLPGTRYGYIDTAGEELQVEATAPDGTITTTPLAQL